ncbi:sigma-70 family RNA polymerase sigma factor [Flavobacteriaceae bacterium]|nr:sigma-70 family RNA polymerase sigma factor [Flavobacteriaceae bacterium]MDA9157351.1 sigma-70 family RNA polymerase sigma factor [Flavobacteriaceae bacterium]MDA9225683.1 sigma-70 family RNA polymerase sigma factor [Flavobacteriaceae bacterium]MDB9873248.1 sigma-70 family RNA polymerase sigma factor [Flavobacteriaceae bacterium]MDC0103569.1 sigma-70 family RNA polymerase sigma factor [Flavobacteriaceae bacterium]
METQQSLFISSLQEPETKEKAFKRLVQEYKERLYWHIRKLVLDHDDANDVVQNTFIKIHLNIDKFKGDSSLYTWMYRIATNESINFINSKSSKMGLQNQEWIEAKANGLKEDSYFDGDEAALILQKIIAKLPEKQRIVFNMKYFDGKTYKSMAKILDTSIGALKASYHHAVKKIKSQLND